MSAAATPQKKSDIKKSEPSKELAQGQWPDFGHPTLSRLRQEFDQLWNRFFNDVPALWNAERGDLRWSFDVADRPEAYIVTAEAPGFEPTDFNIELRGDQLVLRVKREKTAKENDKESFTSAEFYRSMSLPGFVATDKIEAAYDKGVLTVTLPKTEEGKGRKIPVKG